MDVIAFKAAPCVNVLVFAWARSDADDGSHIIYIFNPNLNFGLKILSLKQALDFIKRI